MEAGWVLKQVPDGTAAADRLLAFQKIYRRRRMPNGDDLPQNAGGLAVLRYGNTRDLVFVSKSSCPTAASGTGYGALSRTTAAII